MGANLGVADAAAGVDEQKKGRRGGRRRALWLTVILLVVVMAGAVAWVATKVLVVKSALESAQSEIAAVRDGAPIEPSLAAVGGHAQDAVDATDDRVWRVLEGAPIIGDNLRAVRAAAESLDALSNGLALPILGGMDSTEGIAARALSVMTASAARVDTLVEEVAEARASHFLVAPVHRVLEVAPTLLGADDPRHYLLVFQNNAETLPLGGSAASQTLIQMDRGEMQIVAQANSKDFQNGTSVDIDVDQSAIDLYSEYLRSHVNTTVSRPDFPTAATLLTAFWNRDINATKIDGVISVDPLALARILGAVGPIVVDGIDITETNAVDVLLRDVYQLFDSELEPGRADAFFALTAAQVFERLTAGDFDPGDMVAAVSTSIDNGNIMAFAEDGELAELISGNRVAGTLPTTNGNATTVGVYFRDTSSSKIDYYMASSAALAATCEGAQSSFAVSAGLHLDLTPQEAAALPAFVVSTHWGAELFRTEVFVYGPPGTHVVSATVQSSDTRVVGTDVIDLGRPVVKFEVLLSPGQQATVDAVFAGDDAYGPVDVRGTRMIQATETTITGSPCG